MAHTSILPDDPVYAFCPSARLPIARIQLHNGDIRVAELHWYEACGIGRREVKRKRYLD